jgi:hypothetical protein
VKSITEHIRTHILREPQYTDYETMRRIQWSPPFIRLMRNRMILGGYRYGRVDDPTQPPRDQIRSLIHRARFYLADGNQEHLVDIANLALVEYVRGNCHPNPHFAAVDDDGYHTEEL